MFKNILNLTLILSAISSWSFAGNGAPAGGAVYNLNIIGVQKGKTASMTGNMGHRIFVPIGARTTINLSQGDFQVLDANGTDGSASFQLPNPDADGDGITSYSVFARALGKPGGSARLVTCATDPLTLEEVCSNMSYVAVREGGKSRFTNVTSQLLFIYADLDLDGREERYSLFDSRLENYLWSYDNTGLKLLQLRFYEMATQAIAPR